MGGVLIRSVETTNLDPKNGSIEHLEIRSLSQKSLFYESSGGYNGPSQKVEVKMCNAYET